MAVSPTAPPAGVATVETGAVGSVVGVGPSTVAGSTVSHIGLTSEADGAATLPASCWPVAPAAEEESVTAAGATTAVTITTDSARAAGPATCRSVTRCRGCFRARRLQGSA